MMTTLPGLAMLNGWTMIIRYYGLVKLDIIWLYCNFSLYIFYWKDDITFGVEKFALRNVVSFIFKPEFRWHYLYKSFFLNRGVSCKHYIGT